MPVLPGYNAPDPEAKPSQPEPTKFSLTDDLSAMLRSIKKAGGNKFNIPKSRWDTMATGAGLAGANIVDASAQFYVSAYWLNSYYEQLQNWALVAVAWTNGLGAARAIAKQANKEPSAVTAQDIQRLNPEAYKAAAPLIADANALMSRGWETGIDQPQPLNQQPRTVITGTGNVSVENPYLATVRELQAEQEAEGMARRPSGAEMLFAQLDTLSGVVTGGEGRVDWRSDFSEVKSGGDVQEMETLKRPGGDESAIG